jgi:hypothetical protein
MLLFCGGPEAAEHGTKPAGARFRAGECVPLSIFVGRLGRRAMALWAGVLALMLAAAAVLAPHVDPAYVLRSLVELGAVVGVFALICAAEASN